MTTSIARTLTSNGSRRKGTLSFWYKKCEVGTSRMVYQSYTSGGNNHNILFNTDDTLRFTSQVSSSKKIDLVTTRKFRDPNAWYHIVTAFDTEQGTDTNRAKMYINGVQETSFTNASGGSPTYPSQDQDLQVNISGEHIYFNKNGDGAGMEATCVYSHIHYIDGTMYDASAFGSTDSTTGEWKINTNPNVTYGTNGFFIFKDGNSVTDQSGNSNDFSVEQGTITKSEDNPSNIFATLNPLLGPRYSTQTFSNGNTTVAGGSGHEMHMSTLAIPNSGKYYYEAKLDAIGNFPIIGVVEAKNVLTNNKDINTYGYGYFFNGNIVKLGGSPISPTYSSYTTGDFIGVAVDCDNKEIYFSKNGTWQNSSDPANRTNPAITGLLTEDLMLGVNNYGGTWSVNFGNGAFGSTQLTGTTYQGNGNLGIFKYPVPTGFRALCTKALNL